MKKSTLLTLVVLVIVILGIVWFGRKPIDTNVNPKSSDNPLTGVTTSVPVTETTKVSSKTSKYENAELGFAVNYPTAWEADNTNSGVVFIMPIDTTQVSTIAKLQADVNVLLAKCTFPPVTTIKERSQITIGGLPVNMISMSNMVQGRTYFNRMYSLEKGSTCYMFSFSSITLSPESKRLTGSNITQAQNNNKAIINTADTDFINMVKSFVFVQGEAGQDETKAAPAR